MAVSVVDDQSYTVITLRGKDVNQVTDGADDHVDKLAKKYLGLNKYPFKSPSEKRIILKIKPDSVFLHATSSVTM